MYVFARAPTWETERRTSAGMGVAMVFSFWSRNPTEKQCADSRLSPAKHVVSTMHGTRTVLLDSRSGRYYGLDEVGSRIWSLVESGLGRMSITSRLAEEFDAPLDKLEKDVSDFIRDLKRSRLLVES